MGGPGLGGWRRHRLQTPGAAGACLAAKAARPTTRWAVAVAIVVAAVAVAIGAARMARGRDEGARCGPGFVRAAVRCQVRPGPATCPAPLEATPYGCDAPAERVLIPAAAVALGPSDWEAEGRVTARTVRAPAFRIDAFEATRGRYEGATDADAARAASGMTRAEGARFCDRAGGRLPREDEWILAAVSAQTPPRRYPWGDTGAVCRRAAWGLLSGPCAVSTGGPNGAGPDTVGAHPDGDSPLGLHDMAGNVAEWVAPEADPSGAREGAPGIAKGGSWQSALASDLRIWARLDLDPEARDARVGVRCVYPP